MATTSDEATALQRASRARWRTTESDDGGYESAPHGEAMPVGAVGRLR